MTLNEHELGQVSRYDTSYNPNRLYVISRDKKRQEIGIDPNDVPFQGFDCWNHYEVSCLNQKGKPVVAIAEIVYDCNTPYIVESKSLKLYFNSFNNTRFDDLLSVKHLVEEDLKQRLEGDVCVTLYPLRQTKSQLLQDTFVGVCLDDLDVACTEYLVNPDFLMVGDSYVEEVLYSDLLKSNCLVTNQPDWGSIQIAYKGRQINHKGLLQYLVSFRNHNEFHEQCIERIYMDITRQCQPESLTVYGRYTRRGGLDINPYRSSKPLTGDEGNVRLIRQ